MSTFADQEYLNDPSTGTVGDCWRACIASVIGCPITEVPHFVRDHGDDGWFEATNSWLAERYGETVRYAPVDTWPPDLSTRRPYVILNGGSPRGEFAHCVVADAASGEMVHDPHPSRVGIASVTGAFALVPVERQCDQSTRDKVAAELARWYGHPGATAEFGQAADVAIAAHLDALKADGYVVIQLPEVAYKGEGHTDSEYYRQVADRMEYLSNTIRFLAGSNVRRAARELLYRAADAAERLKDGAR